MGKYDPITIQLTPGELAIVTKPIRAVRDGDAQRRLRTILNRLNRETGTMEVMPTNENWMRAFVSKSGGGGYQDRYQCILWAIDRARAISGGGLTGGSIGS